MNTRTKLKPHARVLCLLLVAALLLCATGAGAQSKPGEKTGGGSAAQSAGVTPSDVVRAFYSALREARFLDALRMSVYAPAVEGLSASELEELRPDFERLATLVPPDFEITGEQVGGEEATVFMKSGEGKEVKVEPVYLIRSGGAWIVGDREGAALVKKQGKKFFFEQRIAAHEGDTEDMLKRIQAAEIAYALQHAGAAGDLAALVDAGFVPKDALGTETTGYQFTVTPGPGGKGYEARAEPARYNRTGRLSFHMDQSGSIQKKDTGGKPFVPSSSKK
ncbi:MAG TPA: hypothetical protein VHU19_02260 [Pyrinomonadaceae bacterium]|jgi:hypothetical protein|nr:hypothetical protein [Pyrinomonadaceae bacterium]